MITLHAQQTGSFLQATEIYVFKRKKSWHVNESDETSDEPN